MIEWSSAHFTGAVPLSRATPTDMAEKRPRKNRFVKAWIDEHVNDHWVKEATRLGYRSRAAFKLIELARKGPPVPPRNECGRPGRRAGQLDAGAP